LTGPFIALMLECDGSGQNMFQRFTDKARRTVVLAQEEARALRHDHIGTEHLLLGLLRENAGVAATALTSLGVTLDEARARVADGVPAEPRAPSRMATGHIPFTPQAKRTLELALREALQLGHDYIGTEHILLGLVHDPECRAAAILGALGADQAAIRTQVIELRPAGQPRPRPSRTDSRSWPASGAPIESVLTRLSAVERFTGLIPDVANMDAELVRLRREKEAAIDAQDFRLAEALSDAETDLLVDRDRRAADWLQRPSLAAELAQLREQVERLRAVLRTHGLDVDEAS
jgi:ClpA/ClpB-like protein